MAITPQARSVAETLERYAVGDLIVDAGTQRVTRDGEEIPLPRLSLAMLLALARHAPDVVSLERLHEEVWDDVAVGDETVMQRIRLLRAALGDASDAPRYVASVRGRGYRLVASVRPLTATSARRLASAGEAPRRWLTAIGAVALLAAGGWQLSHPPANENPDPPARSFWRLAVLPLENMSPGVETDALADGMTEELVVALSRLEQLRVVSHTSAAAHQAAGRRLRAIGRELAVDAIVEGSVRRSGEAVRVAVKLVDARSEEHLWAGELEGGLDDVFTLQVEAARQVAGALRVALTPRGYAWWRKPPTLDFAAHMALLAGRRLYWRYERDANEAAVEHFSRALARDPAFALARAWLANALAQRTISYGFPAREADRALAEARQALELVPELPEAHKVIGDVYGFRGRLQRAEEAYRRALGRWPGFLEARFNLAWVLFRRGRWAEALEHFSALDHEGEPEILVGKGRLLLLLGFEARARRLFATVLEHKPLHRGVHLALAREEMVSGRPGAAVRRMDRLLAADPRCLPCRLRAARAEMLRGELAAAESRLSLAAEHSQADPELLFALAEVRWLRGRQTEAAGILERVEAADLRALVEGADDGAPLWRLAAIAALRGEKASALDRYEGAVAAGWRDSRRDRLEPALAPLRDEPRFRSRLAFMEAEVERLRARVDLLAPP